MKSVVKWWIQALIVICINIIFCSIGLMIMIYLLLPSSDAAYNSGLFFFLDPFVITVSVTIVSFISLPLFIVIAAVIFVCRYNRPKN
jgi:hypothetical protein